MNIYQTVTDRILKQLAAGTLPWRRTWTTGLPKSLTNRKEYRGMNVLVLGTTAFTSRYWVTYREALRLGGHVRKGERSCPVVYWHWRTPEELAKRQEEMGHVDLAPCVPFASAVFNLDQVEGISRPEDDVPARPNHRLELADAVVSSMPQKPEVVHQATRDPGYSPIHDRVTLPHLSQFENGDEYYSTLYHELVHSSGHVKRLNRFPNAQTDHFEQYSFEELVAEFGAAFLCAATGISNPCTESLQASYIEGWSKALREDGRLLVRAAAAAQRAADYIRGMPVLPETRPMTI